jgi:predicted nucleic acid-binding protein
MIAVDANVIVYASLPGPFLELAFRARARDPFWVAPVVWRSEVRNALISNVRQRGVKLEAALETAAKAEGWVAQTYQVSSSEILELTNVSGRSAYDCEYVALARALHVRLITADRALANSFPDICIALEAFVG